MTSQTYEEQHAEDVAYLGSLVGTIPNFPSEASIDLPGGLTKNETTHQTSRVLSLRIFSPFFKIRPRLNA
jgi:hypothetical protein